MIRHTPGEWRVTRGAQGDPFSIEGPTQTIAHVKTIVARSRDRASYVVAQKETEANARLIAAAPTMHEALRFVADAINRLRDMRSVELNNQGQLAEELDDMEGQALSLLARVDGTE